MPRYGRRRCREPGPGEERGGGFHVGLERRGRWRRGPPGGREGLDFEGEAGGRRAQPHSLPPLPRPSLREVPGRRRCCSGGAAGSPTVRGRESRNQRGGGRRAGGATGGGAAGAAPGRDCGPRLLLPLPQRGRRAGVHGSRCRLAQRVRTSPPLCASPGRALALSTSAASLHRHQARPNPRRGHVPRSRGPGGCPPPSHLVSPTDVSLACPSPDSRCRPAEMISGGLRADPQPGPALRVGEGRGRNHS